MKNISIANESTDEEKYKALTVQMKSLIEGDTFPLSSYSNFCAALKMTFDKISWVGFYFLKDDCLYLGPFQGKPACTVIKLGRGVCGTAAAEKKTIIVPDVDQFPGHIACDSASRSEIVVPVISQGMLTGVLDLDSAELNSFNETDKLYLQQLCSLLPELSFICS